MYIYHLQSWIIERLFPGALKKNGRCPEVPCLPNYNIVMSRMGFKLRRTEYKEVPKHTEMDVTNSAEHELKGSSSGNVVMSQILLN